MGFCIYCNQSVVGDTSCPKCYRTLTNKNEKAPFHSVYTPQKKANLTDKWQDTYGKKAIFNNDSKMIKRKMPQFTEAPALMKICAHCKEKKEAPKSTTYNTTFYCSPCLTEKLSCPACQQHFTESESRTLYHQQVWHTDCFKCHQCKCALTPIYTVSDKEGNPCCRVCQLKNSQGQSFSSSISTPLRPSLTTSSSTLTNGTRSIMDSSLYTKYQTQRRSSMLEAQKILSKEQEIRMNRSTSIIPTTTKTTDTLLRKLSKDAEIKPQEELLSQKESKSPVTPSPRRKKVIKRPCKDCGLHVSKKEYRGLRIPSGELLCFHKNCLLCSKCDQHFTTLEFCTDGKNFYHIECMNLQSPLTSLREGSPLSEEEDAYPQTPPSHANYFNIVSESPTLVESFSEEHAKVATPPEVTEISCDACGMSVTDTYLELANHFYHKECLLCAGCNKTVPTDRQLIKHHNKLYCDHCVPPKQEKPDLKITIDHDTPKRNPTVTTPSDFFKSRKKVMPQLGGARTCARCNESMPFSDIQPGPKTSRWHKKCLRCAGCNKQMDSSAHMTVDKETGLCLVHCRGCLDDTPAPRFVRKV